MAVEDQPVEDDGPEITSRQQFRKARGAELNGPMTSAAVREKRAQNKASANLTGNVPPSIVAELRAETAARTAESDAARRERDPKPAVKKAAATRFANKRKARLANEITTDPDTGGLLRGGKPAVYGPNPPTGANLRVVDGFLQSDPPTEQPGWSRAARLTARNRAPGAGRDLSGVMRDVGDVKPRQELALPSQTGDLSGLGDDAGEFKLNQKPVEGLEAIGAANMLTDDPEQIIQRASGEGPIRINTDGDDVKQSAGFIPRPDVIKEQAERRTREPKPLTRIERNRDLPAGRAYGPALPKTGDLIYNEGVIAPNVDPASYTARVFNGEEWKTKLLRNTSIKDTQKYQRTVPVAGFEPAKALSEGYTPRESSDYDFRSGIGTGAGSVNKVNRTQAAAAASAEELEQARQERSTATRGQQMIRDRSAAIAQTGNVRLRNKDAFDTLVPVPRGNEETVAELEYLIGPQTTAKTVADVGANVSRTIKKVAAQKSGHRPSISGAEDFRSTLRDKVNDYVEGIMKGPQVNSGTQRDAVTGITDVRNVRVTRDTRPGTMGDVGRLVSSTANKPRVLPPEVREQYPGMDDDGVITDPDTGSMSIWNERTESVEPARFGPSIGSLPANSRAREEQYRAAALRRQAWNPEEREDDREAVARTMEQLRRYGPRANDAPTFDEAYQQHRAEIEAETRRSQRLGFNPVATGAPGGTDPVSTTLGRRQISNEEAEALIAGRQSGMTARQEAEAALRADIDASIEEVMRRQSAGEDIDINAEIARIKRELGGQG